MFFPTSIPDVTASRKKVLKEWEILLQQQQKHDGTKMKANKKKISPQSIMLQHQWARPNNKNNNNKRENNRNIERDRIWTQTQKNDEIIENCTD